MLGLHVIERLDFVLRKDVGRCRLGVAKEAQELGDLLPRGTGRARADQQHPDHGEDEGRDDPTGARLRSRRRRGFGRLPLHDHKYRLEGLEYQTETG
jgi:hypothetical protein